ncbi:hypothetical protein J7E86_13025 [Streptomyces sp. ISL-11]|nr:hypothetical protein [Streptomyces sp. ISL-11]
MLLAKLAALPDMWSRVTVLPVKAPNFELGCRFDYACLAGVMQFIAPHERLKLFTHVARHLPAGGLLALDMLEKTPASFETSWTERDLHHIALGEVVYAMSAWREMLSPFKSRTHYRLSTRHGVTTTEELFIRDRYFHPYAHALSDLQHAGFHPDPQAQGASAASGPTAVFLFRRASSES